MAILASFPNEILSHIISHVDRSGLFQCVFINRSFYEAVIPLLWRNIHIKSSAQMDLISMAMLSSPRSPSLYLRSIMLPPKLTDSQLLLMMKHVPLLTELMLRNAINITDAGFYQVSIRCPRLTTLEVYRGRFTHKSMAGFGQHCHSLSTLKFDSMSHLDYTKVLNDLVACPLTTLTIVTSCYKANIPFKIPKSTVLALYRHQGLVSLTLDNFDGDYSTFINIASGHQLVWPHLTYLHLSTCKSLTDSPTITFLQAHPQLEYLSLGSTKLTDHTLDAIPTALPVVKHIKLHFSPAVTGPGLARLVKHCPQLVDGIDCYGCLVSWQDDDFPTEELEGHYIRDLNNGGGEIIWVSSKNMDYYQRNGVPHVNG